MTALNPQCTSTRMIPRPAQDQIAGFDVIQTLGTGAASVLYLVHDAKGASYTLKYVPIDGKQDHRFAEQAISEHRIAQHFDDPRIRKSLRVHKIRPFLKLTAVAVILEHVEGTTLNALTEPTPTELYPVFREAAAALAVMHEAGYVHADLKPSNIMVTRAQQDQPSMVKLIDLGQSCPTGRIKQRIQGTPDYMAPEQAKRRAVDERTDVFCLAATMYNLLTGQRASHAMPAGGDLGTLASSSDANTPPTPAHELNAEVPPALSALLTDALSQRPGDRPASMDRFVDRLDLALQQSRRAAG